MLQRSKLSQRRHPISRPTGLALPLALAMLVLPLVLAQGQADPPPNFPPVIDSFVVSEGPGDAYQFAGHVSDPDGSTEGYVVRFGGVAGSYNESATCRADGNFVECFIMPGLQTGIVTADTNDPQGAPSNTAEDYVDPMPY